MKYHLNSKKKVRGYSLRVIIFLIVLMVLLSGCGETPSETPTPTLPSEPVEPTPRTATDPPPPTASPTPSPPAGVLIAPQGALDWQVAAVLEMLESLSMDTDMTWEIRDSLTPAEVPPGTQLIVALYPTTNVNELASAAPGVNLLALGIPDLEPAPNLSRIDGDGFRVDRQAFLAGYLAAVITEDWRVGVITESGAGRGLAARLGFQNGARYFCGLCRPFFPPFENYPLFVEVTPGAAPPEWQAAADLLLARDVNTIYLPPGADQVPLRNYLAENQILIIGSAPRADFPETWWAASIRAAPELTLFDIWSSFSQGETELESPLSLMITDVNPTHISPGRAQFVEALIPDLQAGIVDSGVDPITGESR